MADVNYEYSTISYDGERSMWIWQEPWELAYNVHLKEILRIVATYGYRVVGTVLNVVILERVKQ